jgi:hypothetical protein
MLAIGGMPAQASGQSALAALPGDGRHVLSAAMVTSGKTGTSGKADARAARKARLAVALRENLKRRKQQARDRAVADKTAAAETSSQDPETVPRGPEFRRNRSEE